MKRTVNLLNLVKHTIHKNKNLRTILLLSLFLMFGLNGTMAQNEVDVCDLPADIGNCEESNLRFYYNTERGNCQPFYYTGCEGNDNNYQSYTACISACEKIVSCPEGDPLEWDWIQDIISEGSLCGEGSIRQFESNGNMYFVVGIGSKCNISDYCRYFYDCKGDYVCLRCDLSSPEYPYRCDDEFFSTIRNVTTIWNYEPNCTNPLESFTVTSAIKRGCTDAIYTFDYEGEQYIYLKNTCNFYDELYNCNALITWSAINTRYGYQNTTLFNSIIPMVNEGNLIWTNPLQYANSGIVQESDCGFYIEAGEDGMFEPLIIPDDFAYRGGIFVDPINSLQNGLTVEFDYVVLSDSTSCITNGIPIEITSMRVINEICGCDTRDELPVCGIDGNNYQNACFAYCAGIEIASSEPCKVCYDEDPLQADWIRALIMDDNYDCRVNEIRQFEYDGEAHFMVLSVVDCLPRDRKRYYDCYGNYINNQAIQAAAESANTIWTFDNNPCQDLLEIDFVQSWISDSCTESIYQVEFEGDTFLSVNSDGSCFYENYNRNIYDERNIYHCNSGLALNRLDLTGYEAWDLNHAIHYVLLTEENIVWTRPCTYESKGVVKKNNDSACGFKIESEAGSSLYPGVLSSDFILKENQSVEFTYRTLSDRYECSSKNVEIICIREGCADNEIAICAPVSPPPPLNLEYFANSDNPSSALSLQVEEQTDVQKYFTTTTYNYLLTDEGGYQKTCTSKYHIANQFLKAPDVSQTGVICQKDLWSYIKITGDNQYKIYAGAEVPNNRYALSDCTSTGLVCSTEELNVNTAIPGRRNFSATTYFEFPDGTPCESEATSFHIEIQPEPIAALSTQNKTLNINEGVALMDLVSSNKSGYWTGENIVYLMTATGENIAYFSANEAGVYKLYYTVRNDHCERSYLLVVEVASAGKTAANQTPYKKMDTTFDLYPNPTNNKVFIDLPDEAIYQINITDISGKVMKQIETDLKTANIEVSDLHKGMYLVEVRNGDNNSIQKLMIK